MVLHTRAETWFRVWEAWRDGDRPDWEKINPVAIKEEKAISTNASGREDVVDIAAFVRQAENQGLLNKNKR